METTETSVTEPTPVPQPPQLVLNFEAQAYLREAGKWARFLAIIGFVFCGLILIMAIFISAVFTMMGKISPVYNNMPSAAGGFVSVIYILFDVLYFFFPYYLMQFSDKIKKGIVFQDVQHITAATGKLKSFFKLWGIVTIVLVSLYALIFLIVIVAGIGAAAMHN